MLAGFNAAAATPPVGTRLNGFIARLSPSTGIDAPLTVRALWMENGHARVLIVGLDVLGITPEFAERMVADLSARLEIPPAGILLACSHTHSAPMTAPLRGLGPVDDDYLAILAQNIRQAAIAARADKHPVELAWGTAPLGIAINRRQLMPDGKVVLGYNPHGACESTVRVLRLAAEGRTTIILFHYACHPYFLRSDSSLISPDYFGHAAMELERQGYQSIYLNGCSGDIGPPPGAFGPQAARQAGRETARAVLAACENARVDKDSTLAVESHNFDLPHDELIDMRQIEKDLDKANRTVRAEERGDPIVQARLKTAWREWFDELKQASLRQQVIEPLPARISVARVGDGTIVALPGEVFYDLGRRITRELSGDPVCVTAYCHGYIGYVPDAQSLAAGGYEAEESHRYVGLWRVSPRAERIFTDEVNNLWKKIGEKSK